MWRKPFSIKPEPQVDERLLCEEAALRKLLWSQPTEFDASPRAIAHKALSDRIHKRLTTFPELFSYRLKAPHEEYRCVETWGWRLIIAIDYKKRIVNALYLARMKTPIPTVEQTLEEMDRYVKAVKKP